MNRPATGAWLLAALAAVLAGCASAPARLALANGGFEDGSDGSGVPLRWEAVQHAGPVSYRFVVDGVNTHAGAASLRIDSIGKEPYGSVWQVLPAHGMQGRTVVLTGWLRAQAAGNASDGGGALLLQALRSGYVVAQGVAQPAAVRGTAPWSRYESRLLVPAHADGLRVGVTLVGRGTVWADELALAAGDGR